MPAYWRLFLKVIHKPLFQKILIKNNHPEKKDLDDKAKLPFSPHEIPIPSLEVPQVTEWAGSTWTQLQL